MAQSKLPTKPAKKGPGRPLFTSETGKAARAKFTAPGKSIGGSDMRELRIQQVLDLRIRGMTIDQIAKEFNVCRDTIVDDIRKARQTGLISKYRHQLMQRLVPKAFGVIEHHLGQNNLKAAERVMDLFSKETDRQHEKEVAKESAEESLQDWWQRRKQELADSQDEAPEDTAVDAEVANNDDDANKLRQLLLDANLPPGEPTAYTPDAPSSPPSPASSGADGSDVLPVPPQAEAGASPRDGQAGVAVQYSFGPGGFEQFAGGDRSLQADPEGDEGI